MKIHSAIILLSLLAITVHVSAHALPLSHRSVVASTGSNQQGLDVASEINDLNLHSDNGETWDKKDKDDDVDCEEEDEDDDDDDDDDECEEEEEDDDDDDCEEEDSDHKTKEDKKDHHNKHSKHNYYHHHWKGGKHRHHHSHGMGDKNGTDTIDNGDGGHNETTIDHGSNSNSTISSNPEEDEGIDSNTLGSNNLPPTNSIAVDPNTDSSLGVNDLPTPVRTMTVVVTKTVTLTPALSSLTLPGPASDRPWNR